MITRITKDNAPDIVMTLGSIKEKRNKRQTFDLDKFFSELVIYDIHEKNQDIFKFIAND